MEKLKRSRSSTKGSVTRIVNSISPKSGETPKLTKDDIEVHRKKLEEARSKFRVVHEQIVNIVAPEDLQREEQELEAFETRYNNVCDLLEEQLIKITAGASASQLNNKNQQVLLSSDSPACKLDHQKNAADLIEVKTIKEDKSKNKVHAINYHINGLVNLKRMTKKCHLELQNLVQECSMHVEQLRTLKEYEFSGIGMVFVIHLLAAALHTDLRLLWESSMKPGELADLDEMLMFLKEQTRILEARKVSKQKYPALVKVEPLRSSPCKNKVNKAVPKVTSADSSGLNLHSNRDHLTSLTSTVQPTASRSCLKVYYQNVRGMRTKLAQLPSLLTLTYDYDVIVLTETWLRSNIDSARISPNYAFFRCDRSAENSPYSRGGGVLIAVKHAFRYEASPMPNCEKLEQVAVRVRLKNRSLYIVVIYIPPKSPADCYFTHAKAVQTLVKSASTGDIVLCLGDYNLPNVEWKSDNEKISYVPSNTIPKATEFFLGTLKASGLQQVNRFRNANGRLLDLVFVSLPKLLDLNEPDEPLLPIDDHHAPIVLHFTVSLDPESIVGTSCLYQTD